MIETSQNWKQTLGNYVTPNRPRIIPESFIRISYFQRDEDAQRTAIATSTDEAPFSTTSEITNELIELSSVLKLDGGWALDGSFANTAEHRGYVSNSISNNLNMYSTQPVVTISFPSVQAARIQGVTITWSSALNEWAVDFTVRAYNGSSLVNSKSVTNNATVVTEVDCPMQNYNRIEITISKWCMPLSRARIETVLIGQKMVFEKKDLVSFTHSMSGDLLSFALPDHSVTFEINNIDEEWNPDNLSGAYSYLAERQKITVEYGYTINGSTEWHLVGTYYMSDWNTPQNGITATFTARSLIEFMNAPCFITPGTYTLSDLIRIAFLQSGIASAKYTVDSSLFGYSCTITEDFSYTCAEVVQLCANAGQAIIKIDTNGEIAITKIPDITTDYTIDQFTSYANSEYELSRPLKEVVINDAYTFGVSATGESQTISNDLIGNSSHADDVSAWIAGVLGNRRSISGEYRADPRAEIYDMVTNVNKYATNTIYLTDLTYTYTGYFRCKYAGKVIRSISNEDNEGMYYANDIYSGGMW